MVHLFNEATIVAAFLLQQTLLNEMSGREDKKQEWWACRV